MKKLNQFFCIIVITLATTACSPGDLRAFNDAMSGSNGYEVTYPDQSDTDYVGDIKWITGVRSGSGFQRIINTGDDYCKVKVTYEDGDYDIYNLDPDKSLGSRYVSIYNQAEHMNTLCNDTSRVFNETFE